MRKIGGYTSESPEFSQQEPTTQVENMVNKLVNSSIFKKKSKTGEPKDAVEQEKESQTDKLVNDMSKDPAWKDGFDKEKEKLDSDVKQDKSMITYQDYITKLNSKYGKKLEFVASVGGNMVVNYHNHVVLRVSLTTTDDPLIKYDDFDLEYLYKLTVTLALTPVEQRGNLKKVKADNLKVWGV